MATLRLENLRKEYDRGRIVAVDDLTLDIADGEFVTVVGPSGCGKSTTLRMIAGLETPTAGRIRIGGEDVTEQHARKRDVAMVFQNYALYPHKTVMGNMEFGLRMSTDLSREERREKVQWVAEMMGIEDLLDDTPDELSGGQKKRIGLARAVVLQPEIILYDEPTTGLDPISVRTVSELIVRLRDERGITSIAITHDLLCAEIIADQAFFLADGRIVEKGTLENLRQSEVPQVREFFGN